MKNALNMFRNQMKENGITTFLQMMEEEYGNQEFSLEECDEFSEDVESCVEAFIEDFIWICDTEIYNLRQEGADQAADYVLERKNKLFDRDILKKMFQDFGAKKAFSREYGKKNQDSEMIVEQVKKIYMDAVRGYCEQLEWKLEKIFK